MADLKQTIDSTLAPNFDYVPFNVYKGVGRNFWQQYKTPFIYSLKPGGFGPGFTLPDKGRSLDLGSVDLANGEPPGEGDDTKERFQCIQVGSAKPVRTGYRYTNPHNDTPPPANAPPNTLPTPRSHSQIDTLKAFLRAVPFVAPANPAAHVRRWWPGSVGADEPIGLRVQRLVVSCFEDQALVRALAFAKGDPKATYRALSAGLIDKTHHQGSGAPHHFDVMLSIVNILATTSTSTEELQKMFGPGPNPSTDATDTYAGSERLRRYTVHMGLMCAGLVGNFARYATSKGRAGLWGVSALSNAGVQEVDPIAPCAVRATDLFPNSPPARWNLAGQEDANSMCSGRFQLQRASLSEIKAGDAICYTDVSHVLFIDSVRPSKLEKDCLLLSTVESAAEGSADGLIYSQNIQLRKAAAKELFALHHLGNGSNPKEVHIRRLNHWVTSKCPTAKCACIGEHDLTDIFLT